MLATCTSKGPSPAAAATGAAPKYSQCSWLSKPGRPGSHHRARPRRSRGVRPPDRRRSARTPARAGRAWPRSCRRSPSPGRGSRTPACRRPRAPATAARRGADTNLPAPWPALRDRERTPSAGRRSCDPAACRRCRPAARRRTRCLSGTCAALHGKEPFRRSGGRMLAWLSISGNHRCPWVSCRGVHDSAPRREARWPSFLESMRCATPRTTPRLPPP